MIKPETIRDEVARLIHAMPYLPFTLAMENGDRITIWHPENIAFDLDTPAQYDFYVVGRGRRYVSHFDAVTSISLMDDGSTLMSQSDEHVA